MNPLKRLGEFGQSFWFDYIRRNLLTGGELARLIAEDGLQGMTSNPAIFQKAVAGSTDYAATIKTLSQQDGMTTEIACETLALQDIRDAADQLLPVFEATDKRDGYVSFEVSPRLAYDTERTVSEARRVWQVLGRPNIMIKVPATEAGLPAIEMLLADGINVNATLLFSVDVYKQVVDAWLRALEQRVAAGADPGAVASVASFFVSRIESAVDNKINQCLEAGVSDTQRARLEAVEGQVAIANAKVAYQHFKAMMDGDRWQALADRGAQPQRLLWASTGVKNPVYRDVRYIEELIGPQTVNTIPPATMDAFREHGELRASLEENVDAAREVMATLEQAGISITDITADLLKVGVRKFVDAYDKLLQAVTQALKTADDEFNNRFSVVLPGDLESAMNAVLDDWQSNDKVRRLWARDAWLWTGHDEARWLDWLGIADEQLDHLGDLRRLSYALEGNYFRYGVLLGMGGSSLAPEVIRATLGIHPDHPDFRILDSTDPAQVRAVEESIELEHTVFIVSSKSGSTLEPNILKDYFFQRLCETIGEDKAPGRFAAVTDSGSALEKLALAKDFRRVFHGQAGIGGRYSALSNFGMVPAAAMGVDLDRLLDNTLEMVEACAACVPARDNPGVVLGAILGAAAGLGRDKLTLVASPGIAALGAWLEQLVAESTGKEGKGIIPVDGESPGPPEVYGDDRLFVYLRLESAPDSAQDAAVALLQEAGMPIVRIGIIEPYNLGQEFFRWEIATAVAGAVIGINPFDQPDVEASKIVTTQLTAAYEASGELPSETPLATGDGLTLYTDTANASRLRELAGGSEAVADLLQAHLRSAGTGDYIALLAYLARDGAHDAELQGMRHHLRDTLRVATCVGFGPRFLHSTGQAYKGGPNSGVFLQITCDDAADLPVPGHRYTFGVVKAAQARGDFEVLAERRRRALRVHIGSDTVAGLQQLRQMIERDITP